MQVVHMGQQARRVRDETKRSIREAPLTAAQRDFLAAHARYEGSPLHKKEPHNFDLTPPSSPREDKTLCDEAGIFDKKVAFDLFRLAVEVGLVSETEKAAGFPSQIWVVDADGRVFELMYGGSVVGRYHGYPIRRSNPLFNKIATAWAVRRHV
jgi:hypothetical protein